MRGRGQRVPTATRARGPRTRSSPRRWSRDRSGTPGRPATARRRWSSPHVADALTDLLTVGEAVTVAVLERRVGGEALLEARQHTLHLGAVRQAVAAGVLGRVGATTGVLGQAPEGLGQRLGPLDVRARPAGPRDVSGTSQRVDAQTVCGTAAPARRRTSGSHLRTGERCRLRGRPTAGMRPVARCRSARRSSARSPFGAPRAEIGRPCRRRRTPCLRRLYVAPGQAHGAREGVRDARSRRGVAARRRSPPQRLTHLCPCHERVPL